MICQCSCAYTVAHAYVCCMLLSVLVIECEVTEPYHGNSPSTPKLGNRSEHVVGDALWHRQRAWVGLAKLINLHKEIRRSEQNPLQ